VYLKACKKAVIMKQLVLFANSSKFVGYLVVECAKDKL